MVLPLLDLSLWSSLLDQVLQGLEDPEKVLDQAVDEMQAAWPGMARHGRAWPGMAGEVVKVYYCRSFNCRLRVCITVGRSNSSHPIFFGVQVYLGEMIHSHCLSQRYQF